MPMLIPAGSRPGPPKALSSSSDLLDDGAPQYRTDEFRMFAFKVVPCSKRFCHDWTTCPFAHPSEKAKRRDPRAFCYTGVACPEMKKNMQCPRGNACNFAHNVFEYWLHPSRYRTQLCNDGIHCRRKICFFAHTLDELRVSNVKVVAPGDTPDAPNPGGLDFSEPLALNPFAPDDGRRRAGCQHLNRPMPGLAKQQRKLALPTATAAAAAAALMAGQTAAPPPPGGAAATGGGLAGFALRQAQQPQVMGSPQVGLAGQAGLDLVALANQRMMMAHQPALQQQQQQVQAQQLQLQQHYQLSPALLQQAVLEGAAVAAARAGLQQPLPPPAAPTEVMAPHLVLTHCAQSLANLQESGALDSPGVAAAFASMMLQQLHLATAQQQAAATGAMPLPLHHPRPPAQLNSHPAALPYPSGPVAFPGPLPQQFPSLHHPPPPPFFFPSDAQHGPAAAAFLAAAAPPPLGPRSASFSGLTSAWPPHAGAVPPAGGGGGPLAAHGPAVCHSTGGGGIIVPAESYLGPSPLQWVTQDSSSTLQRTLHLLRSQTGPLAATPKLPRGYSGGVAAVSGATFFSPQLSPRDAADGCGGGGGAAGGSFNAIGGAAGVGGYFAGSGGRPASGQQASRTPPTASTSRSSSPLGGALTSPLAGDLYPRTSFFSAGSSSNTGSGPGADFNDLDLMGSNDFVSDQAYTQFCLRASSGNGGFAGANNGSALGPAFSLGAPLVTALPLLGAAGGAGKYGAQERYQQYSSNNNYNNNKACGEMQRYSLQYQMAEALAPPPPLRNASFSGGAARQFGF